MKAAAQSAIAEAAAGRISHGFDDVILRVEAIVPTLGGIFIDSTGTTVIAWVGEAANDEIARQTIEKMLRQPGSELAPYAHAQKVEIRRGQFHFSELVAGMDALWLRPNTKLRRVAANEELNRVTVGVSDSSGMSQVYEDARVLGIPAEALAISVVQEARTAGIDLTGRLRPTLAGFFIGPYPFADGIAGCSLGYNVTRVDSAGGRFFITAGHCSKQETGTDAGVSPGFPSNLFQPGNSPSDELGWSSYIPLWNESGCSTALTTLCTSADVMQVQYYDDVSGVKAVAKTLAVGLNNASGSTYQVSSMTVLGLAAAGINSVVDKVGWKSGWTRGTVKETCENVTFSLGSKHIDGQSYANFKCQLRMQDMYVLPGDSGGPLFFAMGNPATQAGAIGIVVGTTAQAPNYCSSPCMSWASPWSAIEARLLVPYGGGLLPY